jgi:hypothetical protein
MDFKNMPLDPLLLVLFILSIFGVWKLTEMGVWMLHLVQVLDRCSP